MTGPATLVLNHIVSGGLITNYSCPSSCRHCLYRCGPSRSTDYIDDDTLRRNLSVIQALGCLSIHIGGGEPFLRPERLAVVLTIARNAGISIEYVETNAAWFQNHAQATAILDSLVHAGLAKILLSISPFHNEFIPFSKIQGLYTACRNRGIGVVPWIADFAADITSLDPSVPHSLEEYIARFGTNYAAAIPGRYRLAPGGRALEFLGTITPRRPLAELLQASRQGCRELAGTHHFHLDLYGNYIPGLCAGLSIRREDLGGKVDPEKYPIITTLFNGGIRAFLDYARSQHGFSPAKPDYASKCELCDEIRRFLVVERSVSSPELQPVEYYR